MGWSYTLGTTRKDIIRDITKDQTNGVKCIRKALRGNDLWTVWEQPNGHRFICLFMLSGEKGYGWGYKLVDASMGPSRVSCPLSFLDLAPDGGGYETAWRESVRQYHATRRPKQKLAVGATVQCRPGVSIPEATITSIKPLRGTYNGQLYRLKRRHVA